NDEEAVSTQACDLNAFYQLATKIKQAFKRLPICIVEDSLYACECVFNQCNQYGWKYIMRFKKDRIKRDDKEFQDIKEMENLSKDICWVNDITYNQRTLNVLEYHFVQNQKKKTFTFITNIKVNNRNARKLVNAGRSRWKIENQGFNRQ